jgi:hypothetical protein
MESIYALLAVGGMWIAVADDIAAGRWSSIRDNCRKRSISLTPGRDQLDLTPVQITRLNS